MNLPEITQQCWTLESLKIQRVLQALGGVYKGTELQVGQVTFGLEILQAFQQDLSISFT